MDIMFDYFRFTVRTDNNSDNPYPVDLSTVYSLLGFSDVTIENFQSIGKGSMYYADYLSFDGISIAIPHPETADVMGYMVTMTGSGCRKYEDIIGKKFYCWKPLFNRLQGAVSDGCHINICRLDVATDDKSEVENGGLLDIDEISRCALNREYVSLFRLNADNFSGSPSVPEFQSVCQSKKGVVGRTISFGNRKSNAYLRFYDKYAERLVNEYNGKLENAPDDFKKLTHWVRMEFEFKRTIALKIVNSFIQLNEKDFFEWFAGVVNTYIRFINPDSEDKETIEWWRIFVGTLEKSKLTSGHFKKSDYVSAFRWFERSLAPTLNAMMNRVGAENLINMIEVYGASDRWKAKHKRISDNRTPVFDSKLSCKEIWLSNVPLDILDDYFAPNNVGVAVDVETGDMSLFDDGKTSAIDELITLTEWNFDIETEYMLSKVSEWEEVIPE